MYCKLQVSRSVHFPQRGQRFRMIITGGSIACTLPTALGFFSASVFFRSATALRPPMTTMGKLHTCITAYSRYAEDILSVRNSSRLSVCCRRRWLLDRTLSIAPARKPERLLSSSSSFTDAGEEPIVTVGGEAEAEETIKKSRFIGRCGPATTFEEAKELLSRVLAAHPKARHNCWAWRGVGDDHRFSDDGEPGGTAGQPILGGIQSEGVSEVMVVVTRYSGGIKLGTGGLCRAYSGAARLCLQAAEREMRTRTVQLSVTAPVSSLGGVYHAVSECQRLSEDFTEDGAVVLTVAVELAQVDEVRRRIQDATKGAAEIVAGDERP